MNGLSAQKNTLAWLQHEGLLIQGNMRFSALTDGDLVVEVPVGDIFQIPVFSHPYKGVVGVNTVFMIR